MKMPSLFVSHGSPTFALEPGVAGARLRELGERLPRPKSILVLSPHWQTVVSRVTTATRLATIHDFGGFPKALYEMRYDPAGHPELAQRVIDLLRSDGWQAEADADRGLDHGAWVPLMHLYPAADIPVVQVSMPRTLTPESALAMGRALASLADDGVLIIGSGSLTHNLADVRMGHEKPDERAVAFRDHIREGLVSGDEVCLLTALEKAPYASWAHPTSEHYLPLLFALCASSGNAQPELIEAGVVHGVLSMDSVMFA
ncbi:class III extradiol ring-cleavage dioxygenase [Allohahella marinimesophila]|uniref:Class III extradiol ring-cleavage dioxygenase n=1 Tax=Allohahella marinimesophila TaxID=1054972 RepID=A0ABP7Q5R8_9GAMM